jgi:hypothetical protein
MPEDGIHNLFCHKIFHLSAPGISTTRISIPYVLQITSTRLAAMLLILGIFVFDYHNFGH